MSEPPMSDRPYGTGESGPADRSRLLGGRYQLGHVLGYGGMAEVFHGRDIRLSRAVAVKELRRDLARDPTFQARFRREAQSAAALNHPAIVAVYDTGEDLDPQNVYVDVLAYNSKVYYVITDGAGYGEQVIRIPITGYETVLDAIGQINGLPPVASRRHIWVARRSAENCQGQVMPVDWVGITQKGLTQTNYQVMPGDRIYLAEDHFSSAEVVLNRVTAPFERIFGFALLGANSTATIQRFPGGLQGTSGSGGLF